MHCGSATSRVGVLPRLSISGIQDEESCGARVETVAYAACLQDMWRPLQCTRDGISYLSMYG